MAGLEADGFVKGVERGLLPPGVTEDQAQVVMGVGVGGADGESPAELGLGFRVPARLPQQQAEVMVRVRVVRLQADGFPVGGFRLGAAGVLQDVAEAVARLGERRAEPDGLAVGSLGFRVALGVPQILYAVTQLGKPYVWGGTRPVGYDCSGLIMMAYRAAGVSLPRTTFQQVYAGTAVYSFSDLMPGDLLFTPGSNGTAEDPGHVGMYIGSGLVIQAPQTGEDIEITPFKGYWQQNVVAVRRVV